MAYGKLKADSIIYDDSGSDVEKTIASLAAAAPTANPTFTGTVTIPTATAGDNSTKAASTAFVTTSFATKASPTFTGTVGAATITATGVVSDSKGDVRNVKVNAQGGTHTLVATDAGTCIKASGNVTVPNSVFSQANVVSIINNTSGDLSIIQGSGVTMYNTADAATGNRTLATRGMATMIFDSASVCYISGSGLS